MQLDTRRDMDGAPNMHRRTEWAVANTQKGSSKAAL